MRIRLNWGKTIVDVDARHGHCGAVPWDLQGIPSEPADSVDKSGNGAESIAGGERRRRAVESRESLAVKTSQQPVAADVS
jgi:hypothetical protein